MRPRVSSRKQPRVRGIQSGAQHFFQYNTMLDFGTPPVLGSPTPQCFNEIPGHLEPKAEGMIGSAYCDLEIICRPFDHGRSSTVPWGGADVGGILSF